MGRNHLILLIIIGILLLSNCAYLLFQGDVEPFLYTSSHQMNYETVREEIDVAVNDKVQLQEEMEFVTEEQPMDTTERSTETTEVSTAEKKKKKKKKKKETETTQQQETSQETATTQQQETTREQETTETEGPVVEDEEEDVTPVQKYLTAISCEWIDSDKLLYGKDIDYADIYVKGVYNTGEETAIAVENCTIEGFESEELGNRTCTISYYGLTVTVPYTIINYEIGIICKAWDKRESYRYDDTFSKRDMTIVVNMADGSEEILDVDDYSVTGIDMKKVGVHTCFVTYKEFEISENYEIHNFPVEIMTDVSRFAVRGDVSWSTIADEISVTVAMADGTKLNLSQSEYVMSGYSTSKSGRYEVTLSYLDVSTVLPYQVYRDLIRVDMEDVVGKVKDVYFTGSIVIEDYKDLKLDSEYEAKDGTLYYLEGVYLDSAYTEKLEYPATYYAEPDYRIDKDGLPWHQYSLYARYLPVEESVAEE